MFYNTELIFVVSSLFHISGITMCLIIYLQKKPAEDKMNEKAE